MTSTTVRAEAAFALGRDGAGRLWYGSSVNERSAAASIDLAITRCRQQGPDCQLVRQFKLGCFAFAIPDQTNAAGVAAGATKQDAETKALALCREYSRGRFCTIKHSFCDIIDGPLALFVAQVREAEAQARRNDITSQPAPPCSLSAKAISYSHRICAGGTCDAKFGVIEIIGKNVLQYAGGKAASSGIQYEFGRTNDVTVDSSAVRQQVAADLPASPKLPGSASREFATASYDGQVLSLYKTNLTVTRSDNHFPDNTLLGALIATSKIRIDACSACTVIEFRISGQTIGGPVSLPAFLNAPITEQSCKIESMR